VRLSMKRALVVMGNNFEETEAVAVIDIMRRAKIKVVTASIDDKELIGAHGITLIADTDLGAVSPSDFDLVFCPGGPGTSRVRADKRVLKIVREIYEAGGYVAAICAAPTVLAAAGLLEGKRATFFPGCDDQMAGAVLSDAPVEVDGKIITGQAAGSAITFGITLVETVLGKSAADELINSMYVHWLKR